MKKEHGCKGINWKKQGSKLFEQGSKEEVRKGSNLKNREGRSKLNPIFFNWSNFFFSGLSLFLPCFFKKTGKSLISSPNPGYALSARIFTVV